MSLQRPFIRRITHATQAFAAACHPNSLPSTLPVDVATYSGDWGAARWLYAAHRLREHACVFPLEGALNRRDLHPTSIAAALEHVIASVPPLLKAPRHTSTPFHSGKKDQSRETQPLGCAPPGKPSQTSSPKAIAAHCEAADTPSTLSDAVVRATQASILRHTLTYMQHLKTLCYGCGQRQAWPAHLEARAVASLLAACNAREDPASVALLLSVCSTAQRQAEEPSPVEILHMLEDALRQHEQNPPVVRSALSWLLHRMTQCGTEEDVTRWIEQATAALCALSWHDLGCSAADLRTEGAVAPSARPSSPPLYFSAVSGFALGSTKAAVGAALSKGELSTSLPSQPSSAAMWSLQDWKPLPDLSAVRQRAIALQATVGLHSLQGYWQWVIADLMHCGAEAVDALVASTQSHSQQGRPRRGSVTTPPQRNKGHEFRAVGVLQAIRRVISALSKHHRLQPLLELHQVLTGYYPPASSGTEGRNDFAECTVRRRQLILRGELSTLLWREVVLIDAYTLMSLGHNSEQALDWDAIVSGTNDAHAFREQLSWLQDACIAHLEVLLPTAGGPRHTPAALLQSRLTPRTLTAITAKLREALRLATKVYLRMGDWDAILALHHRCPTMGAAWEVGKALAAAGQSEAALGVLHRFLQDTRQQYHTALPPFLASLVLTAMEGVGRTAAPCGPERVLAAYTTYRTWSASVPPCLCLDALLAGVAASQPGVHVPEVTAAVLRHVAAQYVQDGVLPRTVVRFVDACIAADDATNRTASLLVPTVSELMIAHPLLPILRPALTRCLRHERIVDVVALLNCVATMHVALVVTDNEITPHNGAAACAPREGFFTNGYLQAVFADFPSGSLRALHTLLSPEEDTPSHEVTALTAWRTTHQLLFRRLQTIVSTAYRKTAVVHEAQASWQCATCQTRNPRFLHTCRTCQALDAVVAQCAACNGFSSSKEETCAVCSTQLFTADHIPIQGSVAKTFSLRPWRCSGCETENVAHHSFLCSGCRLPHPALVAPLSRTAYACPSCRRVNKLGMMRPWCQSCGALAPRVHLARGAAPSLWWCAVCQHRNPWLHKHCEVCSVARPTASSVAPPLVTLPWLPRGSSCSVCKASNTTATSTCWKCAATLPTVAASVKAFTSGIQAWASQSLGAEETPRSPRSSHCSNPRGADRVFTEEQTGPATASQHHHALLPDTAPQRLWLCLQAGCLHANIVPVSVGGASSNDAAADRTLHCARCHAAVSGEQPIAVLPSDGPNPMGYRSSPPPAWMLDPLQTSQTPPRRCADCNGSLEVTNLAGVCPACGCSHASNAAPWLAKAGDCGAALRLRLLLNNLHDNIHDANTAMSTLSVQHMLSDVAQELLSVEDLTLLPWRGCDLQPPKPHSSQLTPSAVLQDDEEDNIHSAIQQVGDIIAAICLRSEVLPEEAERRPWLLAAVALVEAVNRSTACDAIGFPVLARLCACIRPTQSTHIQTQTRRLYLRNLKLSREAIINGVVCVHCLGRHTRGEPCL